MDKAEHETKETVKNIFLHRNDSGRGVNRFPEGKPRSGFPLIFRAIAFWFLPLISSSPGVKANHFERFSMNGKVRLAGLVFAFVFAPVFLGANGYAEKGKGPEVHAKIGVLSILTGPGGGGRRPTAGGAPTMGTPTAARGIPRIGNFVSRTSLPEALAIPASIGKAV